MIFILSVIQVSLSTSGGTTLKLAQNLQLLILLDNMPQGVHSIPKLEDLIQERLPALTLYYFLAIEKSHLQSQWYLPRPAVEDNWSACLQTFEGHSKPVNSVLFSHDSKLIASASFDQTVKIWDATSGHCLQMVNAGGVIRVKSFAHINSYVELDYGIIGLSFLGFTCNTS
ncbi:hypothetical protein V8F44DRAFT_666146 [Aspergillus fumigatus]|uniref:Uncharacterized protein n=1 Tax=Aspergillus fumigatus (strain CBS 144.89 / FGSC A1163 / CEA10) TaxID=451804 RepID=B0Y3F4_ASPFC|nr:hypothetical protein AFUB_054010 [Aspergillus fumigatus A1163]